MLNRVFVFSYAKSRFSPDMAHIEYKSQQKEEKKSVNQLTSI